MTERRWKRVLFPAVVGAGLLSLTAGCHYQGRVGVTETTDAERDVEELYPAAIIEFSDQASRDLIRDLGTLQRIKDTDGQVTVIVGDINNQTNNISSSEFELLRSRMRNNLLNSRIARDKLAFVENRARVRRLADREGVASGGETARPADYDPQTTYALNGDFYRIRRGNTNLYYLEMQLVHFGSNQIVFSSRYDIKQVN